MNRNLTLVTILIILFTTFCSCKETKETDDYDNWKERNEQFIAGIASECDQYLTQGITVRNAEKGQMFRLLSYKLDPSREWDTDSYVYCRVLEKGTGSESPLATDSVLINYRLRLMPTPTKYPEGKIADQSYKTDKLDPNINIPASFQVSNLVNGVTTALMYMKKGDIWQIYIPTGLGYGANERTDVPQYSALVFEINLVTFARTGASLPPR